MRFKTITVTTLILISGISALAQSANYANVIDNKAIYNKSKNVSKYVVSVEEWAKMRLDAPQNIAGGWRKVDWQASGISLAVPEEFGFVAHRDDRKTAVWEARRWQSRAPQRSGIDYKVWISVETYKSRGRETTAELLKAEEEFWNVTDGSDVSDLPPITQLRLNGVDGIISRWDVPDRVHLTWTAFRIYKAKLQKIRVEVSGREEVNTGVREILQSIKIAHD